MDENKEKKNNHLVSKIISLVSFLLTSVFLVCSIYFGLNLPHASSLLPFDEDSFTGVVMDENSTYYSTKTGLAKTDFDSNLISSKNLIEEINNKFSLDCLSISTIKEATDTSFIAISVTQTNSYFFLLDKGDLSLKEEYACIDWSYQNLATDGKDLVICATKGNVAKLFTYDLTSFSKDPISTGYVYKTSDEDSDTFTLSRSMKNFAARDMVVEDGYLYLVHSDGVLVSSINYEYNSFGEFKEFEEDSVLKEKYGVVSSTKSSITLEKSKFKGDMYSFCQGIGVSDGTYIGKDNCFYLFTANSEFKKLSLDSIKGLGFPDEVETTDLDISLPSKVSLSNCFFQVSSYEGYITYETNGDISKINFSKDSPYIEFSVPFSTGIDLISQSKDGSFVSIIYRNSAESESGVSLGKMTNIASLLGGQINSTLMSTFIPLTIVFGIVLIFGILCSFKKGFEEKFVATFKRIIKCRYIYLAMLPSLILLVMFCYYPAVASIGLSFFNYTKQKPVYIWNNFEHYKYIFTEPVMQKAFLNMFLFLIVDIVTAIVPPLIFAFFLIAMKPKKLSNVTRTILFLTGIIPGIASNLIWKEGILGTYGVINSAIKACGGNPFAFLASDYTAKWMILLVGFPYVGSYLIFYGGMMNIPSSYYEAAELEGAGIMRRFLKIDVPLIFPQIKYVFICSIINSLQNFARIQAITGGDFDTSVPVTIMYDEIIDGNYGRASAIASIIFILLFFATFFSLKSKKKEMKV